MKKKKQRRRRSTNKNAKMPLCNHFGLFILISSANPLDTWRIIDWVCANIVPLLVVVVVVVLVVVVVAVNDGDDIFFVVIGIDVVVVIVVRTNFMYTE